MSNELKYTKVVAPGLFTRELDAAIGDLLEGVSVDDDQVIVYLREPPTKATEQAVEQVVAAHNPAVKTETDKRAENSREAKTELESADFAALVAATEAARDVTELRDLMLQVLKLVYHCAAAQGLIAEKLPESAQAVKG